MLRKLIKIDIIIDNPFRTSKVLYLRISTFLCSLICIDQDFLEGFRTLTYITFIVELHSVIFSASSSMTDATPMCICPCNPTSKRPQRTSLLYHSTSAAISSSNTSDQRSSFSVYNLTTTTSSTTSASSSLSSSVCYCPCSTTSSTSYMSCKYAYRKWLADSD